MSGMQNQLHTHNNQICWHVISEYDYVLFCSKLEVNKVE